MTMSVLVPGRMTMSAGSWDDSVCAGSWHDSVYAGSWHDNVCAGSWDDDVCAGCWEDKCRLLETTLGSPPVVCNPRGTRPL